MVGHRVFEPQATEPTIRQIQVDLFAQPALGANAKAVTHDQHTYHQLGINRRPAGVAIKRGQMLAQITQVKKTINAAQQMGPRHVIIQVEGVKKLILHARLLTHHRGILPLID